MASPKASGTITIDGEYLAQLLKAINEQTMLCNELLKERRTAAAPLKSPEPGNMKFTQKEIKAMPSLKDCKIRFHKGVYEVRYRKHGFDKSFSHKTLTGAKEKARAFLADCNTKIEIIYSAEKAPKPKSINAADFCEYWLKNVKARQLKEVSLQSFMNKYKKHVAPVLKNYTLKALSAPVIQKIFDSVTTRVAEDVRTIFNGMFKYAMASGLIDHNPMGVIIVQKHERATGTRLSGEQEKSLLELVKGSEFETTVKLYLYTGARPTELQSVKFDWEKGTFSLRNAKLKSYQKVKERTLPIFPTLYAIRDEIESAKIVSEKRLIRYFIANAKGVQIKTLRHTFTSKCKEQGVLPELVNYWTGHTVGSDTSAKIYTHFEMDFQKKEARKVTW